MNTPALQNKSNLFKTVVEGGYCIGCGACAAIPNSPIKIKLDCFGQLQATTEALIDTSLDNTLQSVCPFADGTPDEDEIGKTLYGSLSSYEKKIGYYISTYAGYSIEKKFREQGSSGGFGSWLLVELIEKKLIDGVIHIQERKPTTGDRRLFHYQLSKTAAQISNGAKSKYYPIELSEMIDLIRITPAKYAIVGIPCFIKSVRLLMKNDKILNERIKYCIGLVCGHLKSTRFAEMFGWQLGIKPSDLESIDFRTKLEGFGATQYGVTVSGMTSNGFTVQKSPPVNKLYGANWGLGFFKYKACDYCDDVVGETADVSIGDAWLPQYSKDGKGTNIVVVRDLDIEKLITNAIEEGRIHLEKINAKTVIESQSAGFFHRLEGLAFRLHLADDKGVWRPQKRTKAKNSLPKRIQKKQKIRITLASESHITFAKAIDQNSFIVFKELMKPLVESYTKLFKISVWRRIYIKIHTLINK